MLQYTRQRQLIKFLVDFEISAITIPSYEPTLNPAEQWIIQIKRRLKMQANMNKIDLALLDFLINEHHH